MRTAISPRLAMRIFLNILNQNVGPTDSGPTDFTVDLPTVHDANHDPE